MLSYITWDVSPEIFTVFGKTIVWYSFFWITGILGAGYVVQRIYANEKVPEGWFDKLFWYVVVGTIVGARLGHCLFYDPAYYFSHPLEMLLPISKNASGSYYLSGYAGLASHGGVIGIIAAVWLYSRRVTKRSMIWTFDRLVIGAAFTATCIRLGNLMNSEIFGYPTTLPWAFRFVNSRDYWALVPDGSMGCHPTAIYEALVYFCLFLTTLYLYYKTDAKNKQGLIIGISMIVIFLSRFIIEYLKNVQEEFEISLRATIGMDMGQILSIPFIIWGVWLVWNALGKKKK